MTVSLVVVPESAVARAMADNPELVEMRLSLARARAANPDPAPDVARAMQAAGNYLDAVTASLAMCGMTREEGVESLRLRELLTSTGGAT